MIKPEFTSCSIAIRDGVLGPFFRRGSRMSIGWIGSVLLFAQLFSVTMAAEAQRDIRFGVLGLFHPTQLELEQADGQVVAVAEADAITTSALVLNGEPGHRELLFQADGNRVRVGAKSALKWTITARGGGVVAFRLSIPGRFHRTYVARLTIEARNGELLAICSMDRETAVASIVASEMNENAPMEALKAQAVVSRSFLAGGARHSDFDFCDTTHCQYLKSPPRTSSRVYQAVQSTRGLILEYRDKPLTAMYSSRCGGHTRSLRDIGMESGEGYPYYAVPCRWCQQHPFTWRSRIADSGQPPRPGNEQQRIVAARHFGWSAIPGSNFTTTADGDDWQLEGHSVGHGVGLCQLGAVGMAAAGASFREILVHYYPNTGLSHPM